IEPQTDDRLDLLGIAGRAARVERADLLPVFGRAHRAAGARPMAVLAHGVALDTAPGLDGVAAARRDLEKIRAGTLVEPQRRLRQASRGVIDGREMAPHSVGDAIDGLAVDRGQDALASTHLLHARSTPSLRIGSPRSPTASNASRSPSRPRPRTVK